jgi:amidase
VPYAALRERSVSYASYTALHNFVGTPAMSVPLYWNEAGLPIGSQFSAARGGEKTLFELAYQLEAAQPWANKYPPVFAG